MRGTSSRQRLTATINITPLLDTAFSLLIIFMITAPALQQGMDIKLPQTATNTIKSEERKVLTVGKNETVYLDKEEIGLARLEERLLSLKAASPQLSLYLRADRDVPYGAVVHVMDLIKRAGIDKLGIVTEPIPKEK